MDPARTGHPDAVGIIAKKSSEKNLTPPCEKARGIVVVVGFAFVADARFGLDVVAEDLRVRAYSNQRRALKPAWCLMAIASSPRERM